FGQPGQGATKLPPRSAASRRPALDRSSTPARLRTSKTCPSASSYALTRQISRPLVARSRRSVQSVKVCEVFIRQGGFHRVQGLRQKLGGFLGPRCAPELQSVQER